MQLKDKLMMWFFVFGLLCWRYGYVASADDEMVLWKSKIEEKLIGLEHKVKFLETERDVEHHKNAKLQSSNRFLTSKMKLLESEVKHLKQSLEQVQKRTNGMDDKNIYNQQQGEMFEKKEDYDHEMQYRNHEIINSMPDEKKDYDHEIWDRKREMINAKSIEREDFGHEMLNKNHEVINSTPDEMEDNEPVKLYEENKLKYRNRRVGVPPTRVSPLDVVAFYCYLSKDTNSVLNTHQTIQYDVVPTNKGYGYNKDDGIFTVPRTGLYVFTWTTSVYSHACARTEIMVDGQIMGHTLPDSSVGLGYDTSTGMVVVDAVYGDHVFIRIHYTCYGHIKSNQETTSSFAGWSLFTT